MLNYRRIAFWFGSAAVVAYLVYCAVPSDMFERSPSRRSKVSRVRSDMRSLATGIESYFIDNHVFPAWTMDKEVSTLVDPEGGRRIPSFRFRGSTELGTMTTPIAYLTSIFSDPFARLRGDSFGYYSPGDATKGWILFSPGPDCDFDLPWEIYDPSKPQPSPEILLYSYDPTNGTVSDGDVWRVKQ